MNIRSAFNNNLKLTSDQSASIAAQWDILKPLVGDRLPEKYSVLLDAPETVERISAHQRAFMRSATHSSLASTALDHLDLSVSNDCFIAKDIRRNHVLDDLAMLKSVSQAFVGKRDLLALTPRVHITIRYNKAFNDLVGQIPDRLFRNLDTETLKQKTAAELLSMKTEPNKRHFFGWFSL